MFKIGGVRLFHGLTDGTDDPDIGPLREITSLCGLALGGDDAPENGAVRLDRVSEVSQRRQGIRLAALGGHLLDVADQPIGSVGGAEDFDEQGEAGR